MGLQEINDWPRSRITGLRESRSRITQHLRVNLIGRSVEQRDEWSRSREELHNPRIECGVMRGLCGGDNVRGEPLDQRITQQPREMGRETTHNRSALLRLDE